MKSRNDGQTPGAAGAGTIQPPQSDRGAIAQTRFLAVGDIMPPRAMSDEPNADDITCLTYAEVTAEALDRIRPEIVFSPLVGPGFDCLDLAERLVAAGFRGKYRAVAPMVPDPNLVRREITDRYPSLDFDLVVLADRD